MQSSIFPSGEETELRSESVIESRLEGAFQGYAGRARFKLLNGQVWEQQSFNCRYRYAYMPRATVFPIGDGHHIRIEGVPGTVPVRRVG